QASSTSEVQMLAVQADGRKKPLDTIARETVTQLHGSPSYRTPDGEKLDSTTTFLSLWFNDRDWNREPLILLNYRPLKAEAGLNEEQKYFSFSELMQSDLPKLFGQARQQQASGADLSRSDRETLTVADRMSLMLDTVANRGAISLVPHPTDIKGAWTSLDDASELYSSDVAAGLAADFDAMESAYLDRGTPESINESARELHQRLQQLSPGIYPSDRALSREVFFNRFHAFGKAWHVYAIAFAGMLVVTLMELTNWYWLPMGAFSAGLGIQIYGFALRIAIADRPPVTNMYESVVWVGLPRGIGDGLRAAHAR
ncbi:MAG: cytochrome C biogenesis protein, partial [Cyanobacteria bacterium J06639_1]